ncbi:MAG: hypothetical protein RMJ15_02820 [Nitrososphaerota archaeon]|nr:hypothetical protein [Candidatus Bathyarchaeota archaeon]MDW8022663.1 hypothetical protein [Nitrososphaerota archaeon]
MIEIIAPIIWAGLIIYIVWYFVGAKHYAPLTHDEAKILWKIHKQNARCPSKMWKEIRRGKKIIGFECECGYRHIQKRPIKSNTPNPAINDQVSILRELHKA